MVNRASLTRSQNNATLGDLTLSWQPCTASRLPDALLLQPSQAPEVFAALLTRAEIWSDLRLVQGHGWQVLLACPDPDNSQQRLLPRLPLAAFTDGAGPQSPAFSGLTELLSGIFLPLHWRLDAPQHIVEDLLLQLQQQEGCPIAILPQDQDAHTLRLLRLDQAQRLATIDFERWRKRFLGDQGQ